MPPVRDMSYHEFNVMLGVLGRAAVRTIDIIGGEPTLHPDITTFVRSAVNRGFSVAISSNGSNLGALEEIMSIGKEVTVGISINERETLEQVSGFIRTHKPVVKTVFTDDVDFGLVNRILSLKPEKFHLIYRDALDQHELKAALPFHRFAAEVAQRFDPGQVGTVFCSGFLPDTENYPELTAARCPAGTTKLGVLPDGSVYPCNLFFGNEKFKIGNILQDPFEAVWRHHTLSFFRSHAGNRCEKTSCRLHARCHGGCPAHGFFLASDVSAPDPRCGAK